MILTAFFDSVGQMLDRRFLGVMLGGIALATALLFGLHVALVWGLDWLLPDTFSLPFIGEVTWVDDAISGASVLLMLGLSIFLMVPVAAMFTGLFLEIVADAVEQKHYPNVRPAAPTPFLITLKDSLRFMGVIVLVNLCALVLYFFVGPFAPLLFWSVNGYLLGREYFQLSALRHLGPGGARAAHRRHRWTIFTAGVLMAIPLSVPLLNLTVPVLGAATFTHLFHRLETGARTA